MTIVNIATLSESRIEQVCQLFSEVFGQPMTPQQWRWKFHQGPRLGSVNIVAQDESGKLLGHVGAMVFPGVYRGQAMPMAQVCDVMVSPQARGGLDPVAVYPRMMVVLQRELNARFPGVRAYGFPGQRPFRLGERMGFYRQMYCSRASSWPIGSPLNWRNLWWSVTPADWDVARLDRLWSCGMKHLAEPAVARTGAYLAWRYRDHPIHSYRLWIVRQGGKDAGWIVTRAMTDAESYLIDVSAPLKFLSAAASHAWVRAWARVGQPAPKLMHWLPPAAQSGELTSIVVIEIKVDQDWRFTPEIPVPYFQPGDTDVY